MHLFMFEEEKKFISGYTWRSTSKVVTVMNKDVVQLVGLECCKLPEGNHLVSVNGNSIPVVIKIIDINAWQNYSISHTIFDVDTKSPGLIDYNVLCRRATQPQCSSSSTKILSKFCENFNIPLILTNSDGSVNNFLWRSFKFDSNILPIFCITHENDSDYCRCILYKIHLLLEPLKTLNLFPHYGVSSASQTFKFIIFQLTQLFNELASHGICPIFSLQNILIDSNHWLHISLANLLEDPSLEVFSSANTLNAFSDNGLKETKLEDITTAWCQRKISNFDYLIKLNEFAGRIRGDRSRHPVFPWVCNFSSPEGGFRPLNRTKYRLTKGDAQLSMQFSKQKPSYHIPELLSDICFTVYRARIESKETLSKYVRAKWVPEEYPTSIARLYEWTPDECIPEFFEDPNIFKSIHEDMSDLQLPSFTATPEEFIKWHREMLESDEVSSNLHHWINLTFGYQLSGKAAIAALNVHLNFIEPSLKEKFIGPVQLFTTQHPRRNSHLQSATSSSGIQNPLQHSFDFREECKITNGNDQIHTFTDMYKKIVTTSNESNQYVRNSMLSVGVTITELVLSQHCRNLGASASFDDRLKQAKHAIVTQSGGIPRYLLKPLQRLFLTEEKISFFIFTNPVDTYFNLTHDLCYLREKFQLYYCHDFLMNIAMMHGTPDSGDDYFRQKISLLWHCIEIPNMGDLWLRMFIELLEHRRLAANACYQLLPKLAKYCRREELLKYVKKIQNLIDFRTPHIIKLLDTQFLLSLSMAFGTHNFLEYFVPPILEMLLPTHDNLYKAVKEIVLWIARRYGPILAASAITSKLLCLLPLCFTDNNQRKSIKNENSLSYEVVGDKQCKNVLNCLIEIAIMFGPAFITSQYLPFCADVFEQAKGRTVILPAWESAMIASSVCLKTIVDCLTDKQLMDQLEDVLVGKIIFVSIKLFSSSTLTFSSDTGRKLLAYKTMSALHLISDRIGADNVERHMAFAIQKLFSTFSVIYERDPVNGVRFTSSPSKQLDEIFTPNFALLLLHIFSFTCGRQFTLSIIQNKDLILELEKKADIPPVLPDLGRRCEESTPPPPPSTAFSTSLPHSFPSGNRLSMFSTGSGSSPSNSFDSFQESCTLCIRVNDDNPTHLQGTWVDHFRAVLTSTTSLIPFDQIQLGSFSGHSSTIKKIVALDNENSFITSSSDKTIKLWSLKDFVDVGIAQMSYDRHTKSIQDIVMLQTEGKIISTDGIVHVWDPFCEKTLQRLNWQDNGVELVVNGLSTFENHKFLLSSHGSTMLMSYDVRTMDWANRLFMCPPSESCQGIRTFALSPNGNLIASALSNGCVSVVDIRIGKFLGFAAVSDAEITQVEWLTDELFVIISSDMSSKMFDVTSQLRVIGRLTEPASIVYAPSLREYLTVQPSNRFRFYADGDFRNEIKLHSDFIAGTVTAITYLNLNKMFLIGSNTGMLRLAC